MFILFLNSHPFTTMQLEEAAQIRDQLQRSMSFLSFSKRGDVARIWDLLDGVFADWSSSKKSALDLALDTQNALSVPSTMPASVAASGKQPLDEWDEAEAEAEADGAQGPQEPAAAAGSPGGWGGSKSAAKYLFSGCEMDADAKPIRAKRLAPIAVPKPPAASSNSGWWTASK
jgi:hypothetical protein